MAASRSSSELNGRRCHARSPPTGCSKTQPSASTNSGDPAGAVRSNHPQISTQRRRRRVCTDLCAFSARVEAVHCRIRLALGSSLAVHHVAGHSDFAHAFGAGQREQRREHLLQACRHAAPPTRARCPRAAAGRRNPPPCPALKSPIFGSSPSASAPASVARYSSCAAIERHAVGATAAASDTPADLPSACRTRCRRPHRCRARTLTPAATWRRNGKMPLPSAALLPGQCAIDVPAPARRSSSESVVMNVVRHHRPSVRSASIARRPPGSRRPMETAAPAPRSRSCSR